MNQQPSFDRSLLLPIGVGIFSLLGICLILVGGRFNSSRGTVEEVPTATYFQYAFIGTEPAISTVTLEETVEEPPPADTSEPVFEETSTFAPPPTDFVLVTNTPPSIITLPPLVTPNTPSRTPTSAFAAPFGPGTFDDVDGRFVYSGAWDRQSG